MRDVEALLNSLVSIGRNGLKAILASEATVAVGLPGQERTESCSFGRLCTVFSVEGTDVGRILVAAYAKRAFLGPLRARASACFDCGNSISIHYQLICVIAPGSQRHCLAAVSRKGLMALEGVIVPMCQSPKIDEALLRTQKVPANDNRAPDVETRIKAGPASRFGATCQTLLIFCCAAAFLLL